MIDQDWVIDSSCSFYMSPNLKSFFDFSELNDGFIKLGNNESCGAEGIRNIVLKLKNDQMILLWHIRYVPALKRNLIFLGVLDNKNYQIEIRNGFTNIIKDHILIISAPKSNGIHDISAEYVSFSNVVSLVTQFDRLELWHRKLGLLDEKGLKFLSREGAFRKDNVHKLTLWTLYLGETK